MKSANRYFHREDVHSVQVLIASLEKDYNLLEKVNIQTEAIVCNQCNHFDKNIFQYKNGKVIWYDFDERGVGLNRNNAWMRSTGDVVILCDDDMTFCDGYETIVIEAFNSNKKADVIIFNNPQLNALPQITKSKNYKMKYTKKIGYGASRIAIRRKSVQKCGISFNINFGGGTKYSFGEDSLFLSDCVRKGLNILLVDQTIAFLRKGREGSSWFKGYNQKYFFDLGIYLGASNYRLKWMRAIIEAYKNSQGTDINILQRYKLIHQGIKYFNCL